MSATLTKTKALKPDILLVSGHSKGAATAARQIEEMKIDVPIISYTHCEAAKVQEKFPKSAQGVMCPTQWLSNLPKGDDYFGDAAKWNADFKKAYPNIQWCHIRLLRLRQPFWFSLMLLSVPISFDRDKVRDALAATDMETFYGDIKFAPEGNNIAKPMFYRQIQADGSYKPIITQADMTFPRKADY